MKSRPRAPSLRALVTAIVLDVIARQPAPAPRPRSWEVSYGRRRQALRDNDARYRVEAP